MTRYKEIFRCKFQQKFQKEKPKLETYKNFFAIHTSVAMFYENMAFVER